MLRERNQSFKLMFIGLDLALGLLSFALAFALHFYLFAPDKRDLFVPDTDGLFAPGKHFGQELSFVITYLYLGAFIAISQVVVFIATDLYHPRRGQNRLREFVAIVRGVGLNLLIVVALLFFYRGTSFSRAVIIYDVALSIAVFSAGHFVFRSVLGRLRARGYNLRNVLIIGAGPAAARFIEVLNRHPLYGYRVVGLLAAKKGAERHLQPLIKGALKDLPRVARALDPDLIVYAQPHDLETLRQVVEFCDQEGRDCRIVPDLVELITARARIEDMDGVPLLTIRDIPLKNGYNRFVKRVFDIVFSSVVLLLLAPFFLLIAMLIKLTMPGPIFFAQERVGLDRRIFRVLKFRTMVVQEKTSSDSTWGGKSDARVTPLGAFLRKTSIDELPQFWNVLCGDMSVVGPRPERPYFVEQFKSKYHHYMRRHAAKSGITGWAQIQGLRGDTSIQKRAEADIYYIENWSFWLDILIILKTAPAMIKSPGE